MNNLERNPALEELIIRESIPISIRGKVCRFGSIFNFMKGIYFSDF